MTVRVRMQRLGRPNDPFYRLVAIDRHSKRDGKPLEILGQYNPKAENDKKITVNRERLEYWMKQGAELSKTASSLLKIQAKPVEAGK